MTTFSTGNPIGSSAAKDLYDNAENLDEFVNSDSKLSHPDRLGVERKTWYGMEQDFQAFLANSGYTGTGVDGAIEDYVAGIEITAYNQVIRDGGELWRLSVGTPLPYTTTGAGMPEGGAFVSVGDATLRQQLADPVQGGGLVHVTTSTGAQSVSEALDRRVIYVDTIADLQALPTSELVDGQQVVVADSGLYEWDTLSTSFVKSSYSAPTGSGLVGYKSDVPGAVDRTVKDKLDEVITPADSGSGSGPVLEVDRGNWNQTGGRSYFFNPDSVDKSAWSKNSVVVLGGRGDTGYIVTLGPNAELAFHGGGGDTLLDHLAGTICGGAHHVMTKNSAGEGSHGFIGGGSYNENYSDYGAIVCGTQNKTWATHGNIVGGQGNRVGTDGDREVGRNSFIGSGWLNTLDGKYSGIISGRRCKAEADYSYAWGEQARSFLYGVTATSSGAFATDGDNNTLRGRLRKTTTTATATQLSLDGSSKPLLMGPNTLWTGRVLVSGLRTDTAQLASYEVLFSAYCSGGGVAQVNNFTVNVLHESDSSWNVDLIASANQVQIRGIGTSGATIRWTAAFTIDEVRNI